MHAVTHDPELASSPRGIRGQLTGWKVLAIFFAFFGSIMSVNIVMAYYAISTFSGENGDHPYEDGLTYNRDIAAARAQQDRGWKVDLAMTQDGRKGTIGEARFVDRKGMALASLDVQTIFASPTDKTLDRKVALAESEPGVYRGSVELAPALWDVTLVALRKGEVVFQSHNRVTVK